MNGVELADFFLDSLEFEKQRIFCFFLGSNVVLTLGPTGFFRMAALSRERAVRS